MMKKILLLLFLSVGLAACKEEAKSETENGIELLEELVGTTWHSSQRIYYEGEKKYYDCTAEIRFLEDARFSISWIRKAGDTVIAEKSLNGTYELCPLSGVDLHPEGKLDTEVTEDFYCAGFWIPEKMGVYLFESNYDSQNGSQAMFFEQQ